MCFSRALRRLSLLVITLACTAAARAQATPEATVRQWLDAFNAGDMTKATTFSSTEGTSIIDEFAPFTWTGPKAFTDWSAGFEADSKARGVTEPKVTLGVVAYKRLAAAQAYLTFSAQYTFKLKGAPMQEPGKVAIALRKEGGAWKIAAWTWTTMSVPRMVK